MTQLRKLLFYFFKLSLNDLRQIILPLRVLISFVICRDGSVKDIRIVKSSGFKALDKKAVEVIQKTAPFPRPPVSAELIIPITYKLS